MKKNLLFGLMFALTAPLLAADSSPIETVTNAAAALANSANYTWHTSVEVPADSQFKPGPTDGKTEKDGYTTLSLSTFGDTVVQAVLKGTNGAIQTQDNGWQTVAEATAGGGGGGGGGFNPATFVARQVQGYKLPATEAVDLAVAAKDLKAGANGISGDLDADSVKTLLAFRRGGRGGGAAPEVTNPKGSVTFWVTDGKLTKYQFHVQGSMDFNGNAIDIDRTTTVEIKDVGTTKVEVPADAKKKLE